MASVDLETWDRHHAFFSLQLLALQGSERAVGDLVKMAKGCTPAAPSDNAEDAQDVAQEAQDALRSLAEQWERKTLKALCGEEKAGQQWAERILTICRESLRKVFGEMKP